jgi:hypothetical protein
VAHIADQANVLRQRTCKSFRAIKVVAKAEKVKYLQPELESRGGALLIDLGQLIGDKR